MFAILNTTFSLPLHPSIHCLHLGLLHQDLCLLAPLAFVSQPVSAHFTDGIHHYFSNFSSLVSYSRFSIKTSQNPPFMARPTGSLIPLTPLAFVYQCQCRSILLMARSPQFLSLSVRVGPFYAWDSSLTQQLQWLSQLLEILDYSTRSPSFSLRVSVPAHSTEGFITTLATFFSGLASYSRFSRLFHSLPQLLSLMSSHSTDGIHHYSTNFKRLGQLLEIFDYSISLG